MKYKILLALAASIFILGCGKKAGEAVADTLADTLLPVDVTPVDGAVAGTPTDVTPLATDVTP
jgi:hypothetical protein